MATQRQYLVSLGLAQESRGRFSRVAKEALAKAIEGGMTFDDPAYVVVKKPKAKIPAEISSVEISPVVERPIEFTLPPERRMRKPVHLYGLTAEGSKVEFSSCRRCASFVAFCACKSLLPPSIVATGLDGKPWRMVDSNTRPWKKEA